MQEIFAFAALGFAIVFLFRKFFWKKRKSKKNCGSNDDCGCH